MLGTNKVEGHAFTSEWPAYRKGAELEVNSVFPTIQGEGPLAGQPAIFIRLAGCNLRCTFCDTEFERREVYPLHVLVDKVRFLQDDCRTHLVVITGGEPMRQQVIPLIDLLGQYGIIVQIETAGTLWPPDAVVFRNGYSRLLSLHELIEERVCMLVCSPKTPVLHPNILHFCNAFKYIVSYGDVSAEDGLPVWSTQEKIYNRKSPVCRPPKRANVVTYVQPCQAEGMTETNIKECVRLAMKYGYRLSLQQHKIIGLE